MISEAFPIKLPPVTNRKVIKSVPKKKISNMAFFPPFPAGEFAPVFRLLDDYDNHRAVSNRKTKATPAASFSPKFDVRELEDAYHLDGEIPGANQRNIDIEFTDSHTLAVKGHVEREYNKSDSDGTDEADDVPSGASSPKSFRQPTVEDENEEGKSASPIESPTKKVKRNTSTPKYKYWTSERSVGEFHRTFTFPTRVDQDAVKASLKNGVLSIEIPKASAPKPKKITVE